MDWLEGFNKCVVCFFPMQPHEKKLYTQLHDTYSLKPKFCGMFSSRQAINKTVFFCLYVFMWKYRLWFFKVFQIALPMPQLKFLFPSSSQGVFSKMIDFFHEEYSGNYLLNRQYKKFYQLPKIFQPPLKTVCPLYVRFYRF